MLSTVNIQGTLGVLCGVVNVYVWSRGLDGLRKGEKNNKRGKTKSKDEHKERDLQVLLLIDPGAELGWAVLSETLPSWEAGDVCARA